MTTTIKTTIQHIIGQIRIVRADQNPSCTMITSHGWHVVDINNGDIINKLSPTTYNMAGVWHSATRWEKETAEKIAKDLGKKHGGEFVARHYTDSRDLCSKHLKTALKTLLSIRHKVMG